MAYNTKKILRDRNGDPIPQSYDSGGDRYVPSEIDTRLKAIENQQQEILERLDGTFDTQVTGSIVKDLTFVDKLIPSKTTVTYTSKPKGSRIAVGVRWKEELDFDIGIQPKGIEDILSIGDTDYQRMEGRRVYIYDEKVMYPEFYLKVVNKSEEDVILEGLMITHFL